MCVDSILSLTQPLFEHSFYSALESSEPNPGNRLYRNNGGGAFEDVTDAAGVADIGLAHIDDLLLDAFG